MLLEWNEQIKAHLMWIWGGEDGFMKRKKEGMFVVTERNLVFITKTNMSYRIHEVHSQRQLLRFKENKDVFLPLEGYGITELRNDIEKSDQNIVFAFAQISDMYFLEKRWGSELKIKANFEEKQKNYSFAIVKGWVKYPAKDPLQFQHVDWNPIIDLYKMS
jgi:hypothetical protein